MGRHREKDACRVSVVVPVYNTGEHIHGLIRSLDGQSMPQEDFEVLFVDDGSTDGTGELLDRLAADHPNWVVRHIPNSGWPGTPRNVGLDLARGTYVAFVDHDDYLDPRGLERVCDFADANDSDVVVAREVGVGRPIGRFMFRETIADARLDRDPVIRLLTPHKVYRRKLLQDNGIRFPEGRVRLEDHLFNMRAYFAADRISLYSDHPYYYWTRREGHEHASSQLADPHDYVDVAVNAVLDIVDANTEPGEYRDRIKSHWLEKKLLPGLAGVPMTHYPPDHRERLFSAIRTLVMVRYPEEGDRLLPFAHRVRAHLLRAGRLDDMVALAEVEQEITVRMGTARVLWDGRDAVVHLALALVHRDGSPVVFERREGRLLWVPFAHVPAVPDPTPDSIAESVPEPSFESIPAAFPASIPASVLDVGDEVQHASVYLVARRRGATDDLAVHAHGGVELEPTGEEGRFRLVFRGEARLPLDDLLRLSPRAGAFVVDLNVELGVLGWRSNRRLIAPVAMSEAVPWAEDPQRAAFYATNMGNLSVRVTRPAALPPRPQPSLRQRLRPRRVVRALRRRLPLRH